MSFLSKLLRPRFTTRLLFVFMALFGAVLIPLIWKMEKARRVRLKKAKQERQIMEEIHRHGGTVVYAQQYHVRRDQMIIRFNRSWYEEQRKRAALGRPIDLGVDHIAFVTFRLGHQDFNKLDPEEQVEFFDKLAKLKKLEDLDVSYTKISSLDSLSRLRDLRSLNISGTKMTSLDGIDRLQSLKILRMSDTSISDLSLLSELDGLTRLEIRLNPIKDLTPLTKLRHLKWLDLENTQVVDIAPLRHCPKLETLILISQKVDDWTPLLECPSLKNVYLSRENIDSEDLQRFRDGNPRLSIGFEYWRWN